MPADYQTYPYVVDVDWESREIHISLDVPELGLSEDVKIGLAQVDRLITDIRLAKTALLALVVQPTVDSAARPPSAPLPFRKPFQTP